MFMVSRFPIERVTESLLLFLNSLLKTNTEKVRGVFETRAENEDLRDDFGWTKQVCYYFPKRTVWQRTPILYVQGKFLKWICGVHFYKDVLSGITAQFQKSLSAHNGTTRTGFFACVTPSLGFLITPSVVRRYHYPVAWELAPCRLQYLTGKVREGGRVCFLPVCCGELDMDNAPSAPHTASK